MLHWDPSPEIFTVPIVRWPILWYGILFALGFVLGFPIFVGILRRFFLQRPDFEDGELLDKTLRARALNEQLVSNEPLEMALPPSLARDAACSLHPTAAQRRLKLEALLKGRVVSLHALAIRWTDRVTLHMIVATVIGARLGHYLFYERPSDYLLNPLEILQIWKGGLASHGAAIAIVIALALFAWRFENKARGLGFLHLLDFVAVPTALAGALIRIGNFFNQEILGTQTQVPWGVVFGHPADHSAPAPRHPVQLYEALAYFVVFFVLWRLTFKAKYLLHRGQLIGLFLILVFGFRLIAEAFKLEQSQLMADATSWTMGQFLSIPAILAGVGLLLRKRILDRIHSLRGQ